MQLYDVILLARRFGVSRITTIEAYRREEISRGKLRELAWLVNTSESELDRLLDLLGFLDEEMDDEVLLPDG